MPYRKVCASCLKEFVSDDRSLIEGLVVCDACFSALPDAIEEIGGPRDAPSPVDATPEAASDPGTSGLASETAPSLGWDALLETPAPPIGAEPRPDASATPAEAQRTEPRVHELHWVGTNRASELPVVLPDARDGGYVGRDATICDAGVDLPTVSRIQFAYRNADGAPGIEITNLSQFGTWVNGRLLQRNESAVAPPGSTIEMGGFQFRLREGS